MRCLSFRASAGAFPVRLSVKRMQAFSFGCKINALFYKLSQKRYKKRKKACRISRRKPAGQPAIAFPRHHPACQAACDCPFAVPRLPAGVPAASRANTFFHGSPPARARTLFSTLPRHSLPRRKAKKGQKKHRRGIGVKHDDAWGISSMPEERGIIEMFIRRSGE